MCDLLYFEIITNKNEEHSRKPLILHPSPTESFAISYFAPDELVPVTIHFYSTII